MTRFILLLLAASTVHAQNLDALRRGFRTPPEDAKIMMRWWWFGPSLTRAQVDRDLQKMKEGGIGGVEVQPVYPLSLEGNYAWLSDEFIDLLRYTRERTAALGMRMDLTLGSGWPYGGPHIPVSKAAGRLRIDRINVPAGASHVKAPALSEGESLIAYFVGSKQIPNLEAVLKSDRAVTVTAFISSRSGMQVKRASMGAEGFVLDHYDRSALDAHLKTAGDRLMQAFDKKPPRAVFSDSLEVFASDWTPNFLSEFKKRRGYDITPHLPALADDLPDSGAVRNDWAKTLTELCNENYLAPLNEWAHKHGTLLRSQTYGVPPVSLASQSLVDLPEGEKPHWRLFTPARWASSAAHLYGKPVASTETWTWLHSPAYRATPLDMKAEADLHFLEGITQLVGHGWPSPAGTAFYAAAVFSDSNPWYTVMPDVAAYLQRVSWLLRQGKPANDVAIYLPEADERAKFTPGNVSLDRAFETRLHIIRDVLDAGFNFDFTDDEAIEQLGITHPVLVLPNVERMSAAAAQRIAGYKAKGGIVIAYKSLPSLAPGLNDKAPQKLDAILTDDVKAALTAAVKPDFTGVDGLGFIHRKTADADIYFVVNTTNRKLPADFSFRAVGPREIWDPVTGETLQPTAELAAYESRVVVVSKNAVSQPKAVESVREIKLEVTSDLWPEFFSGVRKYVTSFNYTGGGRLFLSFGEGTPLDGAQGNRPGMRAWLDSPVREAAVIFVNGRKSGSVWKPPYELDITHLIKAGQNTLRIEVANTRMNELAGQSLPNYKLLNLRFGERFQPQDVNQIKPLPSGITGPVKLVIR